MADIFLSNAGFGGAVADLDQLMADGCVPGPWDDGHHGDAARDGWSIAYNRPVRRWKHPDRSAPVFYEAGEEWVSAAFDRMVVVPRVRRVLVGLPADLLVAGMNAVCAAGRGESPWDVKAVYGLARFLITARRTTATPSVLPHLAQALEKDPFGRIVLAVDRHLVPSP